ncbi:MAG: anthranilate phosphoribosyltransferase [Alphaproteobacteria bacterium]|nr:anthranilate phosphoribosyltransferase [Alphaproteobacteria bacterium]MDA8004296.1 anthranilate phosphoribosyltransferase [Alphaproteobacteria bacterium]MDA8012830.1 anthranilate phosphoribosyltransferase [Alphaproteobacteria bacterium]
MTTTLEAALPKLAEGKTLSETESESILGEILDGSADNLHIAAFLMALRQRGETLNEVTGAARAMRARMSRITAPDNAIDTCGTGGDNSGSYNISTATSFTVAAGGIPVAKHGNRAASSRCGAADVLLALGVNLDCPLPALETSLRDLGYAFLMAPRHHSAMRHVAPVRGALKIRTLFNVLGPLCNPAGVRRQVIGCFSASWLAPLAESLGRLGSERVWLLHGAEGYDELTLFGANSVVEWADGALREFTLDGETLGLPRYSPSDLRGGETASESADALRKVLSGARGSLSGFADTVALNAAAAFVVAGLDASPADGCARARAILDSGAAAELLESYASFTRTATDRDEIVSE